MAFEGSLIKIKTSDSSPHYKAIPWKFIKADAYKVTPDQRMESSAGRNASGKLVRTTCDHYSTKVTFETPDGLTNKDVKELYDLLNEGYVYKNNVKSRNIDIWFYNPESDEQVSPCHCYVPDIDLNINHIDLNTNTVFYDSFTVSFIEY